MIDAHRIEGFMDTLGNRIKKERLKLDLSQSELGNKVNVKNSAISNYEANFRVPPADILVKLADVFCCTTDYLLCRTANSHAYVTEININGNNIKINSDKPITEKEAYEFFKQYIGK